LPWRIGDVEDEDLAGLCVGHPRDANAALRDAVHLAQRGMQRVLSTSRVSRNETPDGLIDHPERRAMLTVGIAVARFGRLRGFEQFAIGSLSGFCQYDSVGFRRSGRLTDGECLRPLSLATLFGHFFLLSSKSIASSERIRPVSASLIPALSASISETS